MDAIVSSSITAPRMELRGTGSILTEQPTAVELVVYSETQPGDANSPRVPEDKSGKDNPKPSIHLQLAVLYYTMFLLGFQDGTLGPLLPVIQRNYHVSFVLLYYFCS